MKRVLLPFASPVLVALLGSIAACGSGSSRQEQQTAYAQCLESQRASLAPQLAADGAPAGPFTAELLQTEPTKAADLVRAKLTLEMRNSLQSARASRIAAVRCDWLKPAPDDQLESASDASGRASPSPSTPGSGGGATQVSGTNNQIAGVDEADFVKNDNKYIYVANGSSFRIIEAYPAVDAREIAKLAVPGTARKLFVEGNRALVYSAVTPQPKDQPQTGSGSGQGGSAGASAPSRGPSSGSGARECTYGYDCTLQGDGTETVISIFDITDRAAPQLLRTLQTSSSLLVARRVGTTVHTVLAQQPFSGQSYWSSYPASLKGDASEAEIAAAYDALVAQNEATLAKIDVGAVLPTLTDSASQAPGTVLYQSSMPDGAAVTSVLSLDLGSDPTVKLVSVLSRPGAIFASADAIYMAVSHQQQNGWGWYEGRTEKELSTVHKFSVGTSALATAYRGSGIVKGRVLNQFSMDEKDQKLRIATTSGHLPSPDAHNTLSVMEDANGKLGVIGELDNIAPTEDIRSVRFDGDRGYAVTFKKTDPLYVFDLSDPRAPKIFGELKIPGFSTYMHMMDATHLLTIGYDAADQGDFAYFTGVMLQIFDVSDPTNPTLAHKEIIGTRGSSSEALADHLAFNYFAPKNLLALPMTICEGGSTQGGFGTNMTFSGLMVYDVTTASGFAMRGKVPHPSAQSGNGYDHNGCSNWWSNASSEVRRSIIMDDFVFSVSDRRIKVNNLGALAQDVKEIGIE